MENRSGELLLIKPKRVITDETMLLAESILRSYLTHLRSIYPYAPPHSSTSMVGLFLHVEFEHMKSIEDKLCQQMEHLLDIFVSSNASILQTNPFLHSILFHRQSNIDHFISNYGQALESLSKSTSTQVNLRFIRRRKQFLHFIALEQQRQDDDDLVFQVSSFHVVFFSDNEGFLSLSRYQSTHRWITMKNSPSQGIIRSSIKIVNRFESFSKKNLPLPASQWLSSHWIKINLPRNIILFLFFIANKDLPLFFISHWINHIYKSWKPSFSTYFF